MWLHYREPAANVGGGGGGGYKGSSIVSYQKQLFDCLKAMAQSANAPQQHAGTYFLFIHRISFPSINTQ